MKYIHKINEVGDWLYGLVSMKKMNLL